MRTPAEILAILFASSELDTAEIKLCQNINCLERAEQGEALAHYFIGRMYHLGIKPIIMCDCAIAREFYTFAAKRGHTYAQLYLGDLFAFGEGVTQSYKMACKWYKRAAHQGNAEAMFKLGSHYDLAQGVKRDFQKAKSWWLKAALIGHDRAIFNIGSLYECGEGVPEDHAEARKRFLKSAKLGNEIAQFALGLKLEYGEGGQKDYAEAQKWYAKSAQKNYPRASSKFLLSSVQQYDSSSD